MNVSLKVFNVLFIYNDGTSHVLDCTLNAMMRPMHRAVFAVNLDTREILKDRYINRAGSKLTDREFRQLTWKYLHKHQDHFKEELFTI